MIEILEALLAGARAAIIVVAVLFLLATLADVASALRHPVQPAAVCQCHLHRPAARPKHERPA